jgi:hypothetical protein
LWELSVIEEEKKAMANFLTKLFRRKGSDESKRLKKASKKSKPLKAEKLSDRDLKQPSPLRPRDENEDPLGRTPTATTTAADRGSNASATASRPQKVLSPHSQGAKRGPIDLDDLQPPESDENRASGSASAAPPRLSFQELEHFNRQSSQQNGHRLYAHSPAKDHDISKSSDCSSSDFNLSTDAEDDDYNKLRRRGLGPSLSASNLDTSGISLMSSPTNYTTDEDNAIFPALQTDDDATTATKEEPIVAPEDEGDPFKTILPMAHETEDDMRAWTISPSSQTMDVQQSPKFNAVKKDKTSKVAELQKSSPADAFGTFDAFANFDHFPMEQPMSNTRPHSNARSFLVNVPDQSPDGYGRQHHNKVSSSASEAHPETSLSDLLAQAKRKSSRRKGSSSVNSAPVVTASYLREHHNLGQHRPLNGDSRSVDKTTSVSDIISSLEATNASRLKTSRSSTRSVRSRDHDTQSQGSRGLSTAKSAKERLREKRRKELNRIGSDESDNEEAESWLFDEVTGALGPRGVAADMESLGGKSNRSKSSNGNKSHRSHRSHKSHRSHRSSTRRSKKSSGESVDSRNSRNSRYSHRSTRSYLSQMSEQSRSVANDLLRLEMQLAMVGSQEMNGDEATPRGSGSVTGSTGGASRASRNSWTGSRQSTSVTRRSSAVSKRSKVIVVAPPGKLGIILANKADSKGTVVSGVRTSSVLAEKISPGDRIIAIDGEDVSLMTVSEITTIMARKSDFERQLTVMTTPKHLGLQSRDYSGVAAEADGYYRR